MRPILAAILSITILGSAAIAQADSRFVVVPFTPEWANPQLDASPYAGPPGTEILIRGHRFHQGTRVYFGDERMPIVQRGKDYIVAVVPHHARRDDFIFVVDNTGRARTRLPFQVAIRQPQPWSRY